MTSVSKTNRLLIGACLVATTGIVVFATMLRWTGLVFIVKVADVPGLLAPAAVAATVIERAIEILVSPWRDAGANELESDLAAIRALPADAQQAEKQKELSNELNDYRADTQRYALVVSLILSMCVSFAGIRVLGPFLDLSKFSELAKTQPHQHLFVLVVDATLSAAVLAGGADGVHSVANAITTFFDSTAEKAAQSAQKAA